MLLTRKGIMKPRTFTIVVLIYTGLMLTMGSLIILRDLTEWPTPPEPHWRPHGLLTFMVVASGITTFVFVLFLEVMRGAREVLPLKGDLLRTPIAAAIVVQYLVLVGIAAFFRPTDPAHAQEHPVTGAMVASFTTVVLVIIGFYFGTSSLERLFELQGRRHNGDIGGNDAAKTRQSSKADDARSQ
jgi:hypothetical protein